MEKIKFIAIAIYFTISYNMTFGQVTIKDSLTIENQDAVSIFCNRMKNINQSKFDNKDIDNFKTTTIELDTVLFANDLLFYLYSDYPYCKVQFGVNELWVPCKYFHFPESGSVKSSIVSFHPISYQNVGHFEFVYFGPEYSDVYITHDWCNLPGGYGPADWNSPFYSPGYLLFVNTVDEMCAFPKISQIKENSYLIDWFIEDYRMFRQEIWLPGLPTDNGLKKFKVDITPETVFHSDTASVSIAPVTNEDEIIEIPDTTRVSLTLDSAGAVYGTLLAGSNAMGKQLEAIQFQHVKESKLKYIADGVNPVNCCPPMIKLKVALAGDSTICGFDSARVQCRLNYTKYSQNDPLWADDIYDTYIDTIINGDTTYFKIWRKGCALSCLAMALKTAGFETNPGSLNQWFNDNHSYNGVSVAWGVIPSDKIQLMSDLIKGRGVESGSTVELSYLDQFLNKCYLVIVCVKNNGKGHWVLVTKKENAEYYILDPGYRDESFLKDYKDEIYRVIPYKINN